MGAIGMQDIKVYGKCCHYYKTGFGGLAWQCEYRRQSVAVKGVFSIGDLSKGSSASYPGHLSFRTASCGLHQY